MIVGVLTVRRKGAPAMAGADRMAIEEVVRKVLRDEHADVIRESVTTIAREIMEFEVSELIGAELGERRPDDRATHRNGYRPRRWDTRAGEVELRIPKIRQGSYFPSWSRASGASRRCSRSSSRRVSAASPRVCAALDEHVDAFRTRPLEGAIGTCSSTPRSRRSATAAGWS